MIFPHIKQINVSFLSIKLYTEFEFEFRSAHIGVPIWVIAWECQNINIEKYSCKMRRKKRENLGFFSLCLIDFLGLVHGLGGRKRRKCRIWRTADLSPVIDFISLYSYFKDYFSLDFSHWGPFFSSKDSEWKALTYISKWTKRSSKLTRCAFI